MEGTEGKLGTRFTDGLCGDNADNLTGFNHTAGSQVAAVALCAHALAGFAGENAADFNLLDGEGIDEGGYILADFLAGSDDKLSCERVEDVVYGSTAKDALTKGFNNLILVLDGGCDEAAEGAAVFLGDDDIVGNVHKTAGEVTCISGLEGGIGQTLTGTVGGDEVLQHGHTLFQVGHDRVLNDLCTSSAALLGLGHKATHTAELLDLLG